MSSMLFRLVCSFLAGAALFAIFPAACHHIPENEIVITERAALPPGENTVIWKIRDPLVPGTKLTLRAKHLRPGPEGRFSFVVYTGLRENFEFPRFVAQSEPLESSPESPWSSWELTVSNQIVFVGLTWAPDKTPPVAFASGSWANNSSLNDYAYLGSDKILNDKKVPLKSDLRLERSSPPLADAGTGFASALLFFACAFVVLRHSSPARLATSQLVAFTIGVIFMYRLWALLHAPFWSWGSYYISFLPNWLGGVLVALVPVAGLGLLAWPERNERRPNGPRVVNLPLAAAVTAILIAAAFYFRCLPIYGDWVYGFTNHTHAPLTSAWYAAWASLAARTELLGDLHPQLVSIAIFLPFLLALYRLVRYEEAPRNFWLAVALLLSGSTLQCFFGEVEVYTIPSLSWILFATAAFSYLDGRLPLAAPTIISFVAYLSHVPEALLLFPLVYLWIHELRTHKPPPTRLALRIFGLAGAALAITVLYAAGLCWFKFEGNLAQMKSATTHYGFEVLWGNYRHPGVFMPFFEFPPMNQFTRPGPDFVVFSRDNLLKVLAFQFHYSMFFFLLPALILVRDRFRPLRDPKTAFVFTAFATYTAYISVAYVGWLPLIRDWDLFAAYAFMGALLTWRLLSREADARPGLYLAITAVNLLQTLAWIGINHYAYSLPLQLPW